MIFPRLCLTFSVFFFSPLFGRGKALLQCFTVKFSSCLKQITIPCLPKLACSKPLSYVLFWLSSGCYNFKHLFLIILEVEKSKIKLLADPVLFRAFFLVCRLPSFCCVFTWQRAQVLDSLFTGTLILTWGSTLRNLPNFISSQTLTSWYHWGLGLPW